MIDTYGNISVYNEEEQQELNDSSAKELVGIAGQEASDPEP